MEEKISEIISDCYYQTGYVEEFKTRASEEITSHVFEFIGWLRETTPTFRKRNELFTNTQLYQYWINNIQNDGK